MNFSFLIPLAVLGLCCSSAVAQPVAACAKQLVGINFAGAEFGGKFPGTLGIDYSYPADIQYGMAEKNGFNLIRLPFRWERIEPALDKPLDETNLARLDHAVAQSKAHSLKIILDMHNSAKYYGQAFADNPELINGYMDFWKQIARRYKHKNNVLLGLMNEPIDIDAEAWATITQTTINNVRAQGFTGPVLAPGVIFTGAHSWMRKVGNLSNAEALANLKDPGNNLMIEVHQYFDSDYSGTHTQCDDTKTEALFGNVTSWLREHHFKGFVGEYGGAGNAVCASAIGHMLSYLKANSDVWSGSAYWAGGGAWPQDYPYAMDFNKNLGTLQLQTIQNHTCHGSAE